MRANHLEIDAGPGCWKSQENGFSFNHNFPALEENLGDIASSTLKIAQMVVSWRGCPHESTQANRIKPVNRIKGRTSLVTLRRSHLKWLRDPFVVQTPRSPFYSVRLCRLVWAGMLTG